MNWALCPPPPSLLPTTAALENYLSSHPFPDTHPSTKWLKFLVLSPAL